MKTIPTNIQVKIPTNLPVYKPINIPVVSSTSQPVQTQPVQTIPTNIQVKIPANLPVQTQPAKTQPSKIFIQPECYAKDGSIVPRVGTTSWDVISCHAAGGYKFNEDINANYPCDATTSCNGTAIPSSKIGSKVCGKNNLELLCIGSAQGGVWTNSNLPCDPGAEGSCATSCGPMTTCGGDRITSSRIGAKECGDKNLTYVCDLDGNWKVGGEDGKESCPCMTICPDLQVCDGSMLSKQKVGREVCGIDRKIRICQSNLTAPPEWSYGKKCPCPDDPPEPLPVVVNPAELPKESPADNTMLIAGAAFIFLFMIIIVIIVATMGRKTGAGWASDTFRSIKGAFS